MGTQMDTRGSFYSVDLSIKHLAWAVIEAMNDSLVVTNPEGSVIYLNHAAEYLLNVTFTSVFGRRLDQIMSLLPVGPRPDDSNDSQQHPEGEFKAHCMQGYWLLRLNNELPLVNVSVSSLPPDVEGRCSLLFTIRQIQEEGVDLEPAILGASGRSEVNREEFHKRILSALRASRRWNLEHSLICVQFEMARPEPGEYEQIEATLGKYVRRTDASCKLGSRKYGVLLESYSLPYAIRRSFELIRVLQASIPADRVRQCDLNIWIGVAPINQFGPTNSANLIGMAMLACYEARQAGKGTAVRVYRPNRPPISALQPSLPEKGSL